MRILVTGGAGFVGSVLCPVLLSKGHEIIVLDALHHGGHGLLACFFDTRFRFVHGDVRDHDLVRLLVRDVDAVVHLAAIVGFPACRKYPKLAQDINVEGTRSVVEALSPEQALVYASSGSNYGAVAASCTEESPLNPISLYAITKAEAEVLCLTHPRATALRFATGFGVSPRMRLDLLVNDFVRQAVIDKQLIVYERHFRRTFIGVRDMMRAILFALERIDIMAGQPFNVGHESMNLTKEDIALKVRERVPFFLHFADIGQDEDCRDYDVSYARIRGLGFATEISMDQGIDELIRAMAVLGGDGIADKG